MCYMGAGAAIGGAIGVGVVSSVAVVAGGVAGPIGILGTRQLAEKIANLKGKEGEHPSWKQTAAKVALAAFGLVAIAGIISATAGIGGLVTTGAYVGCAVFGISGKLGGVLTLIAASGAMIGSARLGIKNFCWAIKPLRT